MTAAGLGLLDRLAFRLGPRGLTSAAAATAVLLGVLDHATGPELSFSIFYVAPVAVVAWYVGRGQATALCVLTAVTWLVADLTAGHVYTSPLIPPWNAFVRFGFFIIIARLLVSLRQSLEAEIALADTDALTGLANRRRFFEEVESQIARSRRSGAPFALAYVDLDGFKGVNDRFGHDVGDEVLSEVGRLVRTGVRETDVPARLGGDEFALLLAECDEDRARGVVPKVTARLEEAMQRAGWPVGFSVGVVVFADAGVTAREAVQAADALMYEVKRDGKGAVRYLTEGG